MRRILLLALAALAAGVVWRAGRCPICGMTLSRVEPAPAATGADDARAAVVLPAERVQAIGVKTAPIEFRELYRELRTAGTVAFDPELYGALVEYREVLAARAALNAASPPAARERVENLRRAAARRLALLGLSYAQVDALLGAGADPASLVLPGQSAWVYGQVYPTGADVPRAGDPVVAVAASGRVFEGQVVTVDPVRGTPAGGLRIRALVSTPGGGLRRDAFVRLVVRLPVGRRLALPEDALLDTGERRLVFVRRDDGRFEPRDVVLGVEAEGYYEVLAGVTAGERVVTAANFLIDSESRFRSALNAFGASAADREAPSAAP